MLEYETELVCDFAEYYQIFDIYSQDCGLIATLAAGLRQDSRTKSRLLGLEAPLSTVLLAAAVDRLSLLLWKDPPMVLESLLKKDKKAEKVQGFDSVDDFRRFRSTFVK